MEKVQIGKILCGIDFSESSQHALQYALDLARRYEADLALLHVVELPFLPSYSMSGVPDLSMPVDQLEQNARERLEERVGQCRQEYEQVDGDLRTGAPFVELIDYAQEVGADLIVLGTHGRSALKELLIGSVAEKVVRKADCPVLTVKHPSHTFEKP
ncbi:MAG: universal stress protein [Candidatus Brocadiaceae bacterium]|jgi:nucleotide-binding universal stress UspA family protein